ncbi:hypothetical protein KC332_g8648 [Hortaea werneckii]|uniref:ferroxidase n=2 Tax=Hortaea werneckii TaxID=91943 RepID=A0A3M7IJ78_HORWE|nr:hypothetical protein KC358_g8489 [Hortaea werneckii]OTA22107.1 hypothetical protein BTJ68_14613 [Hortaea werneckii EXF-2000]KAI6829179.1 hypothetical protein KC350_g7912 [Hortaea werneckii]KAI6925724.1 hypothetical protein KC348_g8905 [Hortaea werneckii]KAI6933309.1 hypothetical protein KC341_g8366 [Hortaea werneckii]
MSAPSVSRVLRQATRAISRARNYPSTTRRLPAFHRATPATARCFSAPSMRRAGIMPDTAEPSPSNPEPDAHKVTTPTEISDDEYHELADKYMDHLCERAEQLQETREEVDVEFSAGVMNIYLPPAGTYVVNKQPPNKQLWLSSPISGPKRFDWVVANESMHHKEGGGAGDWIYLRDGSSLTELLRKECGISMDVDGEAEATKKPGVDAVE